MLQSLLIALIVVNSAQISNAQTSTALGQIIYDNPSGDHPDFFPWPQEYGDELILKSPASGTTWTLSDLILEYYGDFTPQGDEKARVRIYKNDGPGKYASPGTLLYDSGDFTIEAGYQKQTLSGLALEIPTDLTWTIQFSGMRGVKGDQAGLLLASAQAAVGKSFKDFWLKGSNGWVLSQIEPQNPNLPPDPVTNPDPVENFGCRLISAPPKSNPVAAKMKIQRADDTISIEWTGDGRLQSSDSAAGGFVDVVGAGNPHRVKVGAAARKFWRVTTAAQSAAAPAAMTIQRQANGFSIQWDGTGRLQSSDSVSGGFADVAGASSPHNVQLDSGVQRYWRVVN